MSPKPARIAKLHPEALKVVEHYSRLRLGGKHLAAPYFMNEPGRRGRRVSVGKGTPRALERETERLAKKYTFDLDAASSEQIRSFMIRHRLGIDCSGLVAWASYALVMQRSGASLWRNITFNGHPLRVFIARNLRPVENVSARLLTDGSNSRTIHDLHDVQPGDIVRSLNGNHVLLITEIGYSQHGHPLYLNYVHSTEYGGKKYGVREGKIEILNPGEHILKQRWIDGENGVNWIFDAANNFPDDTRIVRLNMLSGDTYRFSSGIPVFSETLRAHSRRRLN